MRYKSLAIPAALVWAAATAGAAIAGTVAPGGTIDFQEADACATHLEIPNSVEALARAHASCSAGDRRVRAEVRPIAGAQWIGLRTVRATATMWNEFDVAGDAETTGNTVGAWVSYDANWNGRILFIGFFSPPTVELAIRLRDMTDNGKVIKGEIIWGRDGEGAGISVPYIPFDLNLGGGVDNQGVSNVFSAVLTRGHTYRVEMLLTCAVFSDGGLDVGSECDYMDGFGTHDEGGAGWSRLSVKVGLDETEVLQRLDELATHTHAYLTGRGVGHNNTLAETGAPMEGSGVAPQPMLPGKAGGKKKGWR
jgi:hypothetical protein